MTYDSYGNPVTHTDARGNTTITDYDALTHTYPARITFPQTNGISHIIEHPDYDYRWGKVKTIIIGDVVDKVNFSMLWSW
ncbi:MAG: hypothetical protein JSW26_24885 [Desulfobacterales bacterium]|nr:MAG: hypothetical protein JSW26_24885 [Desulfobacterales bacterium]